MNQEFNARIDGGVAGRDVYNAGSRTTIHINAPVFGAVAGGDINWPPSDFAHSVPPASPPPLAELQRMLGSARAELRRKTLAFYVNWPSALMVLGCLAMGAFALHTLMTLGQPHAIAVPPYPMILAMALTMMGLAWWLDITRRPLRYVMADLRREVHELERAVALSLAGRW